jgi:hypothetical protein
MADLKHPPGKVVKWRYEAKGVATGVVQERTAFAARAMAHRIITRTGLQIDEMAIRVQMIDE